MRNIAIRYAWIASGVFVLWVVMEHILGLNTMYLAIGEWTRLASAFIFYFFIFLCLRARKKSMNMPFTFINAIKTGSLMVIVYSAITAVWLAIYQHLMNPDMLQVMLQFTKAKMAAHGASEEQTAAALQEVERVYSGKPFSYIMYFVFSSIIGIVISGVFGFFLKSRNKQSR